MPQAAQTAKRLAAGAAALALLLSVAALLFFSRLRAPLLEPQEARYAEIPRQMLAEGRFVVPVLHGEPYLDKPPLLYWLIMANYRLFGVHDWAARLIPGLAGVLTVLAAYGWARRTVGTRAALCGALALCFSAPFVYRQRMLTMDGLLCLWVTAALAAAHEAVLGPALRRGWWLLAGVACGLGLLTKGPVALVLVAGPVLAFRLLDRRCARVSLRAWVGLASVAVAVAAPWYAAVIAAMPEFAATFFWKHNVVRFLRPFDHAKPPWFYLPELLLGLLPWTLLLPGFVRFLTPRRARAAARRPPALGFFLLSFLWVLLFFSASGCKRPTYILPALPPLALALGCYLSALAAPARLRSAWGRLWARGSLPATRAATLALLAAFGVVGVAGLTQVIKPAAGLTLVGATVIGLAGALATRRRLSWAACGAVLFALMWLGVLHLQPAYNRQFALRGSLRRTHAELAATGPVPVACYPQRWDSVSFYLPHAEIRVYSAEQCRQLLDDLRARPDTLLLVKSGPPLRDLVQGLPPWLEFVTPRARGPVTVGHLRLREELARR
jgi:4-amino-4-deoxy-L-arabinose transferase-like glycosyltransferase